MKPQVENQLDRFADSYVRLVLAVGEHDSDYVDAYYGPPSVREQVHALHPTRASIADEARNAIAGLIGLQTTDLDNMERLRHQYLLRQLQSLVARVDFLSGRRMFFDEESHALYDAVAPHHAEDHFRVILSRMDGLLPGSGPIPARYDAFKRSFVISKEKLDSVFTAAINESRKRTAAHIALPKDENFTVEYVSGKSWSGYNWYKGKSHSLIQVNTDLPIYIDRAVDLASHEGYPGHHVYNALLEENLVQQRGWREFSVYALFSPQSLIAEGTANYGIEMAFPAGERIAFERDILFPAAALDPSSVELYYKVHELFLKLSYAGNEAARRYLDGEIDRPQAIAWLVEFALMSPERAEQRTHFFDQYRTYVINYNLGEDMVRAYIERSGGAGLTPARRWEIFAELLSSPRLPSGL